MEEFLQWNFRCSRFLEEKLCQHEIARKGDFEIELLVKNRDRMDAVGNKRGDFIGRTQVMSLQSREEKVMARGLRGFHRKEVRPRDGFRKASQGIRTVQRISDRVGRRSGAVGFRRCDDFLDEGGSHQRAGGIMHGDEIRRIGGKGLEAVEDRDTALGPTGHDVAELGKGGGEFGEFRKALRSADKNGSVYGGTILKCAQGPFENSPPAKRGCELVEAHTGTRTGGDENGGSGHE